mmetsp:Transcript_20018/g.32463  ORF Transcript_20018/g.32463 Transcript_20018/m.32463 type:complete len:392 (+) Transcript_20018:479-1654(+)
MHASPLLVEAAAAAAAAASPSAAAATTTPSTAASPAAPGLSEPAAAAAATSRQLLQLGGHLLVGVDQNPAQLLGIPPILFGEERVSHPRGPRAPCTSDAMDVVIAGVTGKVIINHRLHPCHVDAARRHVRRHHHRRGPLAERRDDGLALLLRPVAAARVRRVPLLPQVLPDAVHVPLGVAEDHHAVAVALAALLVRFHELGELAPLVVLLHHLDELRHRLVCCQLVATGAHCHLDSVGLEQISGDLLHILWPRRGEEHRLALLGRLHGADNAANVLLETHVEHAVGLVQNEHLARTQSADGVAALVVHVQHVHHASGRGDDEFYAALQLAGLRPLGRAAVHRHGSAAHGLAELGRLRRNLQRELARGRHDERHGSPLRGLHVGGAHRERRQ